MMNFFRTNRIWLCLFLISATFVAGCTTSANSRYFGQTAPPSGNVLRYISGSEIETLDPQVSSGQPEARVYMALFDGLVEYDPKDMHPIPAIAETWETSPNVDEFIFHLRKNAKFSDGKPITANDFVYSFRRGFRPDVISRTANLGYYIKYAEPFNSGGSFVRKNGEFLLTKDFAETPSKVEDAKPFGAETEFRKVMKSPQRLVLKGEGKERDAQLKANEKLKAAIEGAEIVPIVETDLGVEAIDEYTFRIYLTQPAPFFLGLLAHQFFRVVPQQSIEKHGRINWAKPENYVTSGAFKLKSYTPYQELVVEKDPNYWDADKVKLDGIAFYPLEDSTTMLNLYKAGSVDAIYNHTVPASWVDEIRKYKDEYLDHPEEAIEYYVVNTKKPPMDNVKVRQAFSLAIDRVALSKFRRTTKPLYDFTPEGIFPEYEAARKKVNEEIAKTRGMTLEQYDTSRRFNPEQARKLLAESGYAPTKNGEDFTFPTFPADKISITYNTAESNRAVAEFVQAQWKRNLGITVPLKNMEWKTFLVTRNKLEYDGMARSGWIGDYVDPFAFLSLQYGVQNEGSTGWYDPKFDKILDEANSTQDPTKRYEMMARAENLMMSQQVIIPLQTSATNWIKKPYVKGMYPNPGTLHAWKYVYLERDNSKWDANVSELMK
ncbi:MAG: peptide ABC transporter substrate-binding protein [Pyrinomonadaceae bacterium]|nr:peptide ABC transporter substrate-binding protein [Pyrinomonadaceae bacterium]